MLIILSGLIELKDCSRSQTITYAKQALISRKRCKIETRLTGSDIWPMN